MNHFMLPDGRGDAEWAPMRFGTHAMEALIKKVQSLGARSDRLVAKVFGGAHVLHGGAANEIPLQNLEFVRQFLKKAGIPIEAERVGGTAAMIVRFETHSGRAFVRVAESGDAVVRSESEYREAINDWVRESLRLVRVAQRGT